MCNKTGNRTVPLPGPEVRKVPGGQNYLWSFVGALVGSIITAILTPVLLKLTVDKTLKKLIHGSESEDSFVSYLYQNENIPFTLLTNIFRRATTGHALVKKIENMRQTNHFDGVVFNPVKTMAHIKQDNPVVSLDVKIGPGSRRPLHLDTPLMMALPVNRTAYSPVVLQAFLLAARSNGAALSVDSEWSSQIPPDSYNKHILQLNSGQAAEDFRFSQTDIEAVELTMPSQVPGRMGAAGRRHRQNIIKIELWQHEVTGLSNLAHVVDDLKRRTGGVPVLVRIRTSDTLEINMERALQAGADGIILEGMEHGGMLLPAVLGQDFGLTLPYSLVRAKSFLEEKNSKVSLIAHGRFWEPGDCVKALALGADAVILDSVLVYGLLADQISKALPWFPVETLLQRNSKRADKLDVVQAAANLNHLMKAFNEEMVIAADALGHNKLADLSTADLFTADSLLGEYLNK